MGNGLFTKINIFIRNILLAVIAFLLSRLVYVLFLLGIQMADTQKLIENMATIMRAMAKKFRVNL